MLIPSAVLQTCLVLFRGLLLVQLWFTVFVRVLWTEFSWQGSTTWEQCLLVLARKFSDRHEWIAVEGNVGTVGISHHAQDSLGDVVFAQLPEPGTAVEQKDECGALESVKAASELYSPVSGRIVGKNSSVEETPALINQSCYEKGWLFKIELSKPNELSALMTEEEYEAFLKTDSH
ncbi:glycine cleavage system H protein, mitochondrial isoform X1 [Bacillus rossius redtenbacheri]|uniref:glycine cleavage system H protein, mitochondrial isoform X1 n=1 Tax=Bacillus rossius redtenbacheri TaxID=93214 RepID=UPI002FDDCDBB